MMKLSEAARALRARVQGPDVTFKGVSTDTRTLRPGDLFIALRGENHDGHRFIAAAATAGAAATLVDAAGASEAPATLPALVVDDSRLALGRLSAHWRSQFKIPLVGLTGSSGKTTVKEMLASILRAAAVSAVGAEAAADAVLATRGNLNNDIGVPLMLLQLSPAHRYAVIEMGMNHAGEIRYLTQIACPDVALITNAGTAHIEYLGSEEAIAQAKGEIFDGLSATGVAVINADDRFAPLWREIAADKRRIQFGVEHSAEVSASYRLHEQASEIVITTPQGQASTRLQSPGLHNVRNALAAAAAAAALDLPLSIIATGLSAYSGIKGRLQRRAGVNGAQLIDDTYNANPDSVRAAIDVLAQASGTKILVFGDMGELGADAPRLHTDIGAYAKAAGIDRLLTLGELSEASTDAFGAAARHYRSIESLLDDLRAAAAPDVMMLVKGSRFMRMERIVEALTPAGKQ
ncbi:MAG: UDP-N-acetylmuramoyl-tripeptide--D-alanyl-D-alanine ligase [Pseudomonadota bacterium]